MLAIIRVNKLREAKLFMRNRSANFIIKLFRTYICKARYRVYQEKSLQSMGVTVKVSGVTCADPYILISTLSGEKEIINYSRENFEASELNAYDRDSDPSGVKTIALQK